MKISESFYCSCAPGYSRSSNTEGRECEPTGRAFPGHKEFVPTAEGAEASQERALARHFVTQRRAPSESGNVSIGSSESGRRARRYRVRGRFAYRQK